MRWSWDASLAGRALSLGLVAVLVAVVVVWSTDRSTSLAIRLGTAAATLPLCGALGAFGATALGRRRGELRALAALGVPPWSAARGAIVGGALLGWVGAATLPFTDVRGLFPGRPPLAWVACEDGRLCEPHLGVSVGADGELARHAPAAAAAPDHRIASSVALAAVALPLSAWAAAEGSLRRRVVVGVAIGLTFLAAFSALAAGLAPGAVLLLPALVPALDLALGARRGGAGSW